MNIKRKTRFVINVVKESLEGLQAKNGSKHDSIASSTCLVDGDTNLPETFAI